MAVEQFANDAASTLTADIDNATTSIPVANRTPFPQAAQFRIIIGSEIMLVTAGVGTGAGTFTATRAQEGTTAASHANGADIAHVLTAGSLAQKVADANPMTAAGDIIVGGTNGAETRLAAGAEGTALQIISGTPAWSDNMKDSGPGFGTLTRTYTTNADFSTARDITAAPDSGKKIYAVDIIISGATAALWTVEMETSHNVLAAAYLPANGTAVFTLRGLLIGDANDKKLQVKSSVASAGVVTAIYYSGA